MPVLSHQFNLIRGRTSLHNIRDGVHSILVICYQMMKTGEEYEEKGEAFFARRAGHGKVEQQLVRRLERMGYQVTLPVQPVA